MRLNILSTMAEAPWGGSEELWAGVAHAVLRQRGHVHAVLPSFKETHPKRAALMKSGMEVVTWSYDDLRKWHAAINGSDTSPKPDSVASPYRSLFNPRPDVLLISHGGLMDLVNAHAGMLSELWASGVPYVVVIQANTEGYWPNELQRSFLRAYFGAALQVVFVSRQNLAIARRQLADPISNGVVWQQPVNLVSAKPLPWPKASPLALACVARLDVASKGQDLLLEVLSQSRWKSREWRLNFYGSGGSEALLRELADVGGISDRVQFCGQQADIAKLWRENHVLVLPSRLEGTPLALLEALCCGRPAVVTDVGGSADWISPGQTGFVAPVPTVAAVAEQMELLWNARAELSHLGSRAAEFMARSFNPDPGAALLEFIQQKCTTRSVATAVAAPRPTLSVVRMGDASGAASSAGAIESVEEIRVVMGAPANADTPAGVRLVRALRSNPAAAASDGIRAARSDWVMLVDGSDEVPQAVIEAACAGLPAAPLDRTFCTQPPSAPGQMPVSGIFSTTLWHGCGGFPVNTGERYLPSFWRRVTEVHGEPQPLHRGKPAAKSGGGPRVSVIVTCYNYARYLERCVESVLAQDYRDFEILIVNDGSTDSSPLIADCIAGMHPDRVRVLHQPNSGQPAISRNSGIKHARGLYVLPLDADDWIAPNLLREMVAVLDGRNDATVAYCDTLYCHDGGRVQYHPAGEFSVAALRDANRLSCCSLFRRAAWEKVGGYRTNVRGYEDWDFWLALAAAGANGQRITKPLFFYRAKPTGVFSDTVAKDRIRRAQIMLNNPRCFSAEDLAAAGKLLADSHAQKPAAAAPAATIDHRQQISSYFQAGDYPQCISACEQVLRAGGEDPDVLVVYADVLAKTGASKRAVAVLDRLIVLQPDVADFAEMRAALLNNPDAAGTSSSLVSVVIPCYQQAQYLPDAVQSVLAQTYTNWEILVVNDGSPDQTSEVAQQLIAAHPARRIRLIEKRNGGLADARNAGISLAAGKYIVPLDADDLIAPEFLTKTVALLEQRSDVAIAYTDWVYFGAVEGRRDAIEYDFNRLCTKENLFTCTSLYRREAWVATGGYNPNMTRGVEDWDFWINCGKHGFRGQRIPEPLFYYRAKEKSMIHDLRPHLPAMFARIVMNHPTIYTPEAVKQAEKVFSAANLPPPKESSPGVEWTPPSSQSTGFSEMITSAQELLRQGQVDAAIAQVEEALKIAPNADCASRGQEILALLLQTKAAAGAGPEPSTPATPSDSAEEFFGTDEIAHIEKLIAAFAENPNAAETADPLHELQEGLMKYLVTADVAALPEQFKGGFGKVFRLLARSGLASAARPEGDGRLDVLDEALAESRKAKTFDFRPLLARMLFAPAHHGAPDIDAEQIPAWLLADYVEYAFRAPAVFVLPGEAAQYHAHVLALCRWLRNRLKNAADHPITVKAAEQLGLKANFIPLYFHDGNTREVSEVRGLAIDYVLRRNGARLDFKPATRPTAGRKIRVGFLNAHFGAQTETHITLPMLRLDPVRFEKNLFALGANPGPVQDYARSFADQFTMLPGQLAEQVKAIRDAQLDVLIVGTNVTAVTNQVCLLAAHRLAPVQLAAYTSPVTTGLRHMDGYLTGSHTDVAGLAGHFSEKLRFSDGPPGCFDYTVEAAATTSFSRESLRIGADETVFINAAACFKILPEMQDVWIRILNAVPNSRLVLLPFNPNWSNAFPVKQFERTLLEACARHGVDSGRLVLTGSLRTRADVKALETLADVYLDTAPFSGSISVVDPLELGLPVVVQEGLTHRSRMAAALLRDLDVTELIVRDEAGYIALATKLGLDPAYRRQMAARISAGIAKKPTFLDPDAYAEGLGILIEELVAGKKPKKVAAAVA